MTTRDHVLRTLAAVAPGTRVVAVGCRGGLPADFARLGLDVWACDPDPDAVASLRTADAITEPNRRVTVASPTALGYPDAFADWAALDLASVPECDAAEAFAELTRVVALGGWMWLAHPDGTDALLALELPVGVVPAEAPQSHADGATVIFRRVDDSVVG